MPFSATMLPPILVALWYKEDTAFDFLFATVSTLLLGFLLWLPFRKIRRDIQSREAFLIVTLLWLVLTFIGALPFLVSTSPEITLIDALYETISGLTTTGSTVLQGLDSMPRSLLYYRQQLQLIGGGGIIVLGVAILPMLGVGGMQLFRAEVSGPFKEDKLTPRVTQTSKALWLIYVGLVIICAFCYWLGGMEPFDAITHSYSTISTGGFSTHDKSFSYFNSPSLELMGTLFMILGAVNFSLHFSAIRRKSLLHYWQDPEFNIFLKMWFLVVVLIFSTLLYYKIYTQPNVSFFKSLFQTTSFFTTTGFFSTDYSLWPSFLPMLLIFVCLIGGCAESTAGGLKIIRFLVLKKQATREIKRLIHPNSHNVIKLGQSQLHYRTLDAIQGFFIIYVIFYIVLLLLLLAMGLDFLSAFSAVASAISNTGIGLGSVATDFQSLNESTKAVLCFAMIAGRLELFTVLVLLTPNYWRY